MIEGALVLLAGITIGILGERVRTRRASKPTPAPMCACEHAIAFHDLETGRCHEQVQRYANGVTKLVRCECRRYTGPEPLPRYYAPDLDPEIGPEHS
jgi:hypothetical protein